MRAVERQTLQKLRADLRYHQVNIDETLKSIDVILMKYRETRKRGAE